VTDAAVTETHSAVVFFFGDRAYKVKKSVDLGFLDFSSRAAREAACHREVELNRRLSPDVYLGVADMLDPDGEVCEHIVVMRRMPADRRLSRLVTHGADVNDQLGQLARLLAAFHAAATRSPAADRAAGAVATAARWGANTTEMLRFTGQCLREDEVAMVHGLASRYLDGRDALFADRIAHGRACDGHGDLLAEDIFCLDDGPRVLDCIEFDDELRLGDGLADVAFLAMDLDRLGRRDLAGRFLEAYRQHANDAWPPSLAHHHIAYRAQVRAKVAAIRAEQGAAGAAAEASSALALAHAHLLEGRVRLVVVGGLPGTGKSTLAAEIADALDAVVLRSDHVRKELAGLASTELTAAAFEEGIYEPDTTSKTYHELFRRAGIALGMGESVVIDASFTDARRRDAARVAAAETFSDHAEIRCTAPFEVAAARIRARASAGDDASDASAGVAVRMADHDAPWLSARSIDTNRDRSMVLQDALSYLHSPNP